MIFFFFVSLAHQALSVPSGRPALQFPIPSSSACAGLQAYHGAQHDGVEYSVAEQGSTLGSFLLCCSWLPEDRCGTLPGHRLWAAESSRSAQAHCRERAVLCLCSPDFLVQFPVYFFSTLIFCFSHSLIV